jgi:lipoprotein-anchoring transpeptidase ErfK/SrfK
MSFRRVVLSLAAAAALSGVSCSDDPPDKEMQAAQAAIDAAGAVGADRYSHDEFIAAQQALARAKDAVTQRDYRLALSQALDARTRGQNAEHEAAGHKAAARSAADGAISDATTALRAARASLKAAETNRAPARALIAGRRAISDSDKALQKARTAFGREDFPAVTEALNGVTARLQLVIQDLAVLTPSGNRRRH